MGCEKTIRLYLEALEKKSYQDCSKLFTEDGVVVSPLYGEKGAHDFYKEMFGDTTQTKITLLNIFSGEDKFSGACHFICDWTLKDGTPTSLNVVDVFEFSDDGRIKKLIIIYDTSKVRQSFEKMKG